MLEVSNPTMREALVASKDKIKVALTNQVQDGKLVALAEDGQQGSWTMVFDEGFELRLGDKRYFAHFAVELIQGIAVAGDMLDRIGKYYGRAADHELEPAKGHLGKYGCHCDKTAVGWVAHGASGNLSHGCFYANRVLPAAGASASMLHIHRKRSLRKQSLLLKPSNNVTAKGAPILKTGNNVTAKRMLRQNFAVSRTGDLPKHFDWREVPELEQPRDDLANDFQQGSC